MRLHGMKRIARLGGEFLIELDALMDRIAESPSQFPEIKQDVRRALLRKFPYSVYFKVGDETVDIIAVLHQHRDTRIWEQRIQK